MERALRPDRFEVHPNTSSAEKEFRYWIKTLENYIEVLPAESDKLKILINHLSPDNYEYINECTSFESATEVLSALFTKPTNVILARHLLGIRKQKPGEALDEYYQALKTLCKDCDFRAVDAANHRNQRIRDIFIAGLQSDSIKQRVLEDSKTDLEDIYNQARTLELAGKNLQSFSPSPNFGGDISVNSIHKGKIGNAD